MRHACLAPVALLVACLGAGMPASADTIAPPPDSTGTAAATTVLAWGNAAPTLLQTVITDKLQDAGDPTVILEIETMRSRLSPEAPPKVDLDALVKRNEFLAALLQSGLGADQRTSPDGGIDYDTAYDSGDFEPVVIAGVHGVELPKMQSVRKYCEGSQACIDRYGGLMAQVPLNTPERLRFGDGVIENPDLIRALYQLLAEENARAKEENEIEWQRGLRDGDGTTWTAMGAALKKVQDAAAIEARPAPPPVKTDLQRIIDTYKKTMKEPTSSTLPGAQDVVDPFKKPEPGYKLNFTIEF